MVLGVFGDLREPNDLFGIDGLAVDHRGHLAVASARVKTDAAAFHVAADLFRSLVGGGEVGFAHGDDLERLLVHVAYEAVVERALAFGRVDGGQLGGDVIAAA